MKRSSTEDFVVACVRLGTVKAVAEHFGVGAATVSRRAAILRKKGVAIPKFRRSGGGRGPQQLDVDALNALITSAASAQ